MTLTCALVLACVGDTFVPGGESTAQPTLTETWRAYREGYVSEDGRVIDRGDRDRTTSEGQAYAMVRAVWMDDRTTFDRAWSWTNANLRAGDHRLPAWHWGARDDGTWGVIDAAPASDSDQWMAWALLAAAERWKDPELVAEARILLEGVWTHETALVAGQRVIVPGPWARSGEVLRLNPSYWLTFAWRDFARMDPEHDWTALIEPAYRLLEACRGASGLAVDWCYVRVSDGAVQPPPAGAETHADFGFEAFRVAWTLAADSRWHGERRARRLLRPYAALARRWREEGKLPGVIRADGTPRVDWSYLGLYGALLPSWRAKDAAALRAKEIESQRAPHGWGRREDYYSQNWVWFGLALRDAPPWRAP